MPPSASIGSTVAGIRPSRFSVMTRSVGSCRAGPVTVYYRTLDDPAGVRPNASTTTVRVPLRDNRSERRRSTMAALDDFSLDGLVALVSGGGGAIGSALAVAIA